MTMIPGEIDLKSLFKSESDLLAAILQDDVSGEVLMLGWVNREALELTLATGKATFWSRSRNSIWVKGETSGNYQEVLAITIDCDRDAFLFKVKSSGPVCHTGKESCFHEQVMGNNF